MDRVQEILLEALREGAASSSELRLYRSGKLPGLFASRSSQHVEAAAQAVRDGLIEITRTEPRGKTVTEWARVTPKGTQFVLDRESPVRALEELQALLKVNGEGLPAWAQELRRNIDELAQRFVSEVEALRQRFEFLTGRVQDAIRRMDKFGPAPADGAAAAIPWANLAVDYLERRLASGLGERCPLPELFGHLREKDEDLTIRDFHIGLRRLYDRGAIRLLTFDAGEGPPEPEYALLEGPTVYWYAAR